MGVEPTAACSAQPATNFEDWGIHRDTTIPLIVPDYTGKCVKYGNRVQRMRFGQYAQSPFNNVSVFASNYSRIHEKCGSGVKREDRISKIERACRRALSRMESRLA